MVLLYEEITIKVCWLIYRNSLATLITKAFNNNKFVLSSLTDDRDIYLKRVFCWVKTLLAFTSLSQYLQ